MKQTKKNKLIKQGLEQTINYLKQTSNKSFLHSVLSQCFKFYKCTRLKLLLRQHLLQHLFVLSGHLDIKVEMHD